MVCGYWFRLSWNIVEDVSYQDALVSLSQALTTKIVTDILSAQKEYQKIDTRKKQMHENRVDFGLVCVRNLWHIQMSMDHIDSDVAFTG